MKVVLKHLNTPNKNGVIYTKEAMQQAIERLDGKAVMGQLGTNTTGQINLSDLACMANNIQIEEDAVVGDITVLQTPMGEALSKIKDDVDFRFVGLGKVDEDGTVSDFTISYISVLPKDAVA